MIRRLAAAVLLTLVVVPAEGRAADTPDSKTVVTDGPVDATLIDSAGRMYLGGSFSYAGPRLGHGIALTAASADPGGGLPDINGAVLASAPDGAGGEFIGGSFTTVGGVTRNRLAHIRADRTLDPDWNPGADKAVRALAVSASGDAVFVGGDFNKVGGLTRFRLARVSSTGAGAVDASWDPGVSGNNVRAIAVSGSDVFVGGSFSSIGGVNAPRLAKVEAGGAGTPDPTWAPNPVGQAVDALAVAGPDLYVGGEFTKIDNKDRAGLAKVATTGAGAADPTWDPSPFVIGPIPVRAMALSGTDIFVGGDFTVIGGGNHSQSIAKLSATGTGSADTTWTPDATGGTVDALALSGSQLIAGGSFTHIGGQFRNHLAQLSTTGSGAADPAWDPNANGEVHTVSASATNIFAGGDFTSAGPLNEFRGALIRLKADGSLDKDWSPLVTNGPVLALALDGTDLFVGGGSFSVGPAAGVSRAGLAKVTTTGSGALDTTWDAPVNGTVNALAVSAGSLFVGGAFAGPASIGGADRNGLAKVSTNDPAAVDATWNPNVAGAVNALALSGGNLFVGGAFFGVGGQPHNRLAKVSTADAGAVDGAWGPNPNGTVNALLVSGSGVFAGGAFSTIGGQTRLLVAKLSTSGAGDADPAWDAGSTNGNVLALALSGDNLYVGGSMTTVGAQPRNRIARVSAASGALDSGFSPAASVDGGAVNALAATSNRVLAGGAFGDIGPLSTSGLALFDLSAPTVSIVTPPEGARYRQGQVVNAAYSCSDADGLSTVSCSGPVTPGSPIDTATAGAKTFTVTASDTGGNSSSTTTNYMVDGSAPDISIAVPPDGSSFVAGTDIDVSFSCTDADGPADVTSCVGTAANGTKLDTSAAGMRSFTVTAGDAVGNTSTKTVSYRVVGVPPVLGRLKIAPKSFKAKKGARVSFTLSKANAVTFKITRKKGKKTVTVGTFTRGAKTGRNSFKFGGRARGSAGNRLKPGAYLMSAHARAPSGLKSKTLRKPFRVLKP